MKFGTLKLRLAAIAMLAMALSASAQYTVMLTPSIGQMSGIQMLSDVQIVNPGTQTTSGFLQLECTVSGRVVVRLKTGTLTLTPGMNAISNLLNRSVIEQGSDVLSYLQNTGFFPEGPYLICATLYRIDNTQLGYSCQSFRSTGANAPVLVAPPDKAVLKTFFPVFTWLPARRNGDFEVTYDFRLAELLPGQSYAEAMASNPALVFERDLRATTYVYPASALALQEDKMYVWQVSSVFKEAQKQASEIWMFRYKKDVKPVVKEKPKEVAVPYPHLSKTFSASHYIFDKYLSFYYKNYSKEDSIDYKIAKVSKSGESQNIVALGKLALNGYDNYIKLNLPEQEKTKKEKRQKAATDEGFYIFSIVNSRKELWGLKFTMTDESNNNLDKNQL